MAEAYLEVARGTARERVPLGAAPVTIGRAAGNVVALVVDASVSDLHAVVQRSPDGWSVVDAGSTNGTYVNGVRLTTPHVLRPGDEIVVGATRIGFGAGDTAAEATRAVPAFQAEQAGYLDVSEEWSGARTVAQPASEHRPAPVPTPPRPEPRPAAPRPVAAEPDRRRGSARVRGIARSVNVRRGSEQTEDVLTMRVDRYDASGNRLAPVGVELRPYTGGHVGDGEEVEVEGTWKRGTLRAQRIVNLSTHAELRGRGKGATVALSIVFGIVVIFILGIFATIAYAILGDVL